MRSIDIIEKKRDGVALANEEICHMVNGYTHSEIPDYQMAAFLMAVYLRGMDAREGAVMCDCMAHSGDMLDLSRFGRLSADKHSTGGVGDKTTFLVAPIAACLGCKTAKMSGRGLGHTGGTIDKLESIPGFRVELSAEEFMAQVEDVGVAVIGATGDIAPADKAIYALRDVTGTVGSIPLIAASIMSKKLAAGTHNIVLDVTVGSGAFMKTQDDANALARAMVDIGTAVGKNMTAVLTNMDEPLGRCIGNQIELEEALLCLSGKREGLDDLITVSLTLAAYMTASAHGIPFEDAYERAEKVLASGEAYEKFIAFAAAQGADEAWLRHPEKHARAPYSCVVRAEKDGYLYRMNAEEVGISAMLLGAGRSKKDDILDLLAGIHLSKKVGDYVHKGEEIAVLYACDETRLSSASARFTDAITYKKEKPEQIPHILGVVTS